MAPNRPFVATAVVVLASLTACSGAPAQTGRAKRPSPPSQRSARARHPSTTSSATHATPARKGPVTLAFAGSITGPGFYDLTGSSLMFSVPAAPATESSFGSISLTITANGSFDDLSLLGCLTTGSDCLVGNQLSGNFRIPAALLNAQNVPAIGLDQPHPLDLLEDDGTTDIHGSITTYSYTGSTSAVPEPSSVVLLIFALPALSLIKKQLHNRRKRI